MASFAEIENAITLGWTMYVEKLEEARLKMVKGCRTCSTSHLTCLSSTILALEYDVETQTNTDLTANTYNLLLSFLSGFNGTFEADPTVVIPNTEWVIVNEGVTLEEVQELIDEALENYDSSLTEDITSDVTEGNINTGDIIPIGTTLTDFVKKFLIKIFYPQLIAPTFSLSNNAGTREVGAFANFTATFTFDRGQIYQQWNLVLQNFRIGTAMTSFPYKFTWTGGSAESWSNIASISKLVTLGTNTITATVKYNAGPQPLDSKGNPFDAPYPAGESPIQSTSFQGAYYNFYQTGVIATNSIEVRALTGKTFGNTFALVFTVGQTQASFAYPASRPDISNDSIKYAEGFNSGVGDTFTKSTFNVNDAGGNPVAYKIYTVTLAAPFSAVATYNVTLP